MFKNDHQPQLTGGIDSNAKAVFHRIDRPVVIFCQRFNVSRNEYGPCRTGKIFIYAGNSGSPD